MKIKRLYIIDPDSPSARRSLCWEDEHGKWMLGETNSPNAFAQALLPSPAIADQWTEGPHPELMEKTFYYDWLTKGENGPSYEVPCIVDPVIIEAWRRWNTHWYDTAPVGNLELPKPGHWTVSPDGLTIQRTGDLT